MIKTATHSNRRYIPFLAPLLFCAPMILTGCSSSYSGYYDSDFYPSDRYEPVYEEPVEAPRFEDVFEEVWWTCRYSPTMNYDWHDDVLCDNGSDYDRPYLLPDWDFVEYDDIMTEAMYYQDWLNETYGPAVVPRD